MWPPCWLLATGNRIDDDERLLTRHNGVGERSVGRVVVEVFFAGSFTIKEASVLRVMVADGPAQHGIAGFERVEG